MPTGYALITGGTKGIGLAVARLLASKGYPLILTYGHDHEAARGAAAELAAHAPVVELLEADATCTAGIDAIADALSERDITLRAVVMNAGITCRTPFEEITIEEWQQVFFANVHFPTFLIQRLLPRIERGGCVLFTGSLMGIEPHGMALPYGVSKSAVHALTRNLVKHLEPYGIRVNAVAPGFVDTEWQKTKPAEIRRSIESKVALHRFALPEEIAEAFLFLFTNAYCNGEILTLDGGYSFR
ncbi:SDR family NAD(P)-dependent oxidoreductase [Porphyromonas loveana]|uniref:SDR family NAD(P)-dependent oxidoreductase n=1 Tax=Porphyromonas loveana TaxID=1884669 RepID=UPI0035A190D8